MILDSTFLIDITRHDEAAIAFARRTEAAGQIIWTPTPALFELWEGTERADRPSEETQKVSDLVSHYTVMTFEARHAERAGRLSGQMARRGRMMDPLDAQIAGMALAENLPVVTRNVRDFKRVEGLKVITY